MNNVDILDEENLIVCVLCTGTRWTCNLRCLVDELFRYIHVIFRQTQISLFLYMLGIMGLLIYFEEWYL